MHHRRLTTWATTLAAGAAIALLPGPPGAFAQEGGFDIEWQTIDCGGDTSFGGDLEFAGTIGQSDVGVVLTGGDFEFTGGFWALPAGGAPCLGDIDGSGDVAFGDILAILGAWGQTGGPEDIDGSGTVDFGDLLLVLGNWGACP